MAPAKPISVHIAVTKTARYYTLGPAGARDVWFVLHGFGQLAGQFITYFADLDDGSRLVVAPEALNRYYTVPADAAPAHERPVGATWMTREDRLTEIADYVAYLDALHAATAAAAHTVTLVGFSQGAATATRWFTQGQSRIDRLILWGGLTPPDTDLPALASKLADRPLTLVIGERDQYISADALATDRGRLSSSGIRSDAVRFDGGHGISRAVLARLASSGAPQALRPTV